MIVYKSLTPNKLREFIGLSIKQLLEEGAREETDLRPALRDYYERHMADGTFVGCVAENEDDIVGTAAYPLRQGRRISATPTEK